MNNSVHDGNVIIQTKITCPPVKNVVQRERLYERLDEGRKGKLTLISAPAGYGKTTLVASWIESRELDFKWITLDRFDTSVSQILHYLYVLFEEMTDGLSGDDSTVITKMLNRLSMIPKKIILVLDDYHLAESAEIRDFTSMILEYIPPNFHIVILTRVDPQLRLSRLRGQGEVLELHESDLRFNPEETSDFLSRKTSIALDSQQIKNIAVSTEGWVAGLQIITSSITGCESFRDELSWDKTHLLDYLVEEVLSDIDQDVKDFLLKISILDRFNADLCDAVTGRTDSQQLLEYLEHHNLFLSPLDNAHGWYRLHNLFSNLLYSRCVQTYGDNLTSFYTTASAWLENHGYYVDAVDYMFKADDIEKAASLIDRYALEILKRGNLKSVMHWAMELPISICRKYAVTMFFHAWFEINEGRSDSQIDNLLDEVEKMFPSSPFCMLRSYIAMLQGDSRKALQIARKAKGTLFQPYSFIGGIIDFTTALAKITNNEIEDAMNLLSKTFERALSDGNTLIAVMSLDYKARVLVHKGELDSAETLYRRAARLSTDVVGEYRWLAGSALIGLGEIDRIRGDLESAEHFFHEGIAVSAGWVDFQNINAHIALAQIYTFTGDSKQAFYQIDEAERLAQKLSVTMFDDRLVSYYHNLILLRFGCFEEVESRTFFCSGLDSFNHNVSYLELYTSFSELLLESRLLLARKHYSESASLAEAIDEIATQLGWPMHSLEARLILIQCYWFLDEKEKCRKVLLSALRFSSVHRIIQMWADEGPLMKQVLCSLTFSEKDRSFVSHLLQYFHEKDEVQEDELLSTREIEVLSLFAQGLTNKEIAGRLCLSERTVKWHSSNIYRKLKVKNRTQAVNSARRHNLIG